MIGRLHMMLTMIASTALAPLDVFLLSVEEEWQYLAPASARMMVDMAPYMSFGEATDVIMPEPLFLSQARGLGYMQHVDGAWSLTPLGKARRAAVQVLERENVL